MAVEVHMEPLEFSRMEPENCSVCRTHTRYWYTPHIPLCQNCAVNYVPEGAPHLPFKIEMTSDCKHLILETSCRRTMFDNGQMNQFIEQLREKQIEMNRKRHKTILKNEISNSGSR